MRVAIVGGGVIGSSIAYHLRRAGAEVVLIERGEIGGEASSAAAGMLIAPIEDTEHQAFNALRIASLAMYPGLIAVIQSESGIDIEYKRPGMLRAARSEAFASELQALSKRQPGLEWVEGEALRSLEPELAPDVIGGAYSESDCDLNPGLLTKALAGAAEASGARVVTGTAVTGFSGNGGRIHEVSTDNGDYRADAVVLAAGPWTEFLTLHLGLTLRTPPMRGQMLAYRSMALRHAVWGEDGYLIPKPRGATFAGATVEDSGFDKANTTEALSGLRGMASALVPCLGSADVERCWAGLRPGSPDGMPVIGRVPNKDNVYIATGHFRNGIILAPITGALVARLVVEGVEDERLRPFRVERFG